MAAWTSACAWPSKPASEAAVTDWIPLLVVVILTNLEPSSALKGSGGGTLGRRWLTRAWDAAFTDLEAACPASCGWRESPAPGLRPGV